MKILRRTCFSAIIFFICVLPLLFLFKENALRALVIFVFLLLWLLSVSKTKNMVISSALYILITLPFNITYQMPSHVLFFNTDPYVNGIYTNYLVPTLSILDMGLVLLAVSYLYEYGLNHTKIILKKYLLYLIFFFIFILGSVFIKSDLLMLINGGRILLFIMCLILSIDYFRLKNNTRSFHVFAYVLIISTLFQGILGILQFTHGTSLGLSFLGESQVVSGMQGSSFVTLNDAVFLRAYGTFPHPNIFGGYLLLNFLLGWYFLFQKKRSDRMCGMVLMLLSSVFVAFTFSRICILLTLILICVTILSQIPHKRLFSFTFGLIFVRFMNLLSENDNSWTDRVKLIKSGWQVFKENWLVGTGLGSFTRAMGENIPQTTDGVLLIQPVHNVLFLMLCEFGVLGTLLYFLLLLRILLLNIKRMNLYRWLIVFTLVIIGSFDHYLFSLPQGIIMDGILLLLLTIG